MKPETKTLVAEANRLLSIWQEQEQTRERAWEKEKSVHTKWIVLMNDNTSIAQEIRAAYREWREICEYNHNLPSHYDTQREWSSVRAKAQLALARDAGLLRSEEDKSYDEPEEPAPVANAGAAALIALRQVPVLDETGNPMLDPETNEPMQKTEVDFVGTALANPKVVEKFGEAIKGIIEKVAEKHEKENPDAK